MQDGGSRPQAERRPESTDRFTGRVENYVRYRPDYPEQVVSLLEREAGLVPEHVVADIGSGTGISSRLFLDNGNEVYGVEPNAAMRAAAVQYLNGYERFHSIDGLAEATTLPDGSIDLIVAAQAFHWFDRQAARAEFVRILRLDGPVILIWNTRRTDSSPFLHAYEQLLQDFGTDYRQVDHTRIGEAQVGSFLRTFRRFALENSQEFGYDGLEGRLLSSSYVPSDTSPVYRPMLDRLKAIFDRYAVDERVRFEYETEIYVGRV